MTIRGEIDALNEGFSRDLAAQDVESLVARYADDAQFLFTGRPILRGRQAVETIMREWVADGPVNVRFESRDVIADGSLAVDVGVIIGPSGPTTKYVVVYRRQPDGSLRIAIDSASGMGASPPEESAS
jgi:ketosteroid isomerase-like protein